MSGLALVAWGLALALVWTAHRITTATACPHKCQCTSDMECPHDCPCEDEL